MVELKETEIGQIPIDWELKSIDDIKSPQKHSISMGPFGSNIRKENYKNTGVPVIRGLNLKAERFLDDDFAFLTEEKADELKNSNVFPEDIVFTAQGNVGQVGIIPKNAKYKRYVLSQNLMKITCDKIKVNPFFIFYFFRSNLGQHEILSRANTTGVPCISQPLTSLKSFTVPIPDLKTQNSIAKSLTDLDNKIELNRKMNQTLEQIAQAIFKHWFIDFEFPKENGTPYKSSGGEMVDSELGLIPNSFKIENFESIAELAYGKGLKAGLRIKGNVPVMGSNDIIDYHNNYFVKGPGIVVGRKGTIGTVKWIDENFWPIDTTFYVNPTIKEVNIYYIYFLLKSLNLDKISSDSAIPGLNRNFAYAKKIAIPTLNSLDKFNEFCEPVFKKIKILKKEILTLTKLRNNLLPKLISGKIRV